MVNLLKIKRAFFSLSGRLMTGITAIHFILIPLLLGSVLYFVNNTMKEQFISDTRHMMGLIAASLTPIDFVTNRITTINLMDEIILSGNILYAEISLPDGNKITSLLEVQNKDIIFIEDLEFDQHNDDIYFIEIPIDINDVNVVSTLRVGFDEKPLTEQLDIITMYLCSIILAYIVINLVLVFYLGRRTTMPLKKLRQASREIRQGHIDADLDIQSPVTDVRDLAIDLDLMRQELVSQASALKHQALHDALTGLPNRVLLEDRLQQAALKGNRKVEPFALLLMDLNRFKEVNDTLGHQAGDEVLRQAALRLRNAVRSEDTVARLGGDEFAVILYGTDNNSDVVAESLAIEMQRAFTVGEQTLHVGASIGISHYPEQSKDAEELMRQADIAMYEAKRSGLHYKTYHKSHDKQMLEKLALSNEFHEAIITHQIILHYQPKIDLRTGEFSEVEALARWNHSEHGLIMPEKFITLAEKKGFIIDLTNSLLQTAINDAAKWYHLGHPIEVSLNLSPKNLLDDDLPQRIERMLKKANLPAKYISLEITENAIIQDPGRARDILLTLKEMGVRSAIDDFGTGYSSLVYIRQLPVSEIKIDKSFVVDMIQNDDDLVIVKATTRMAHDLGLTVTAEGVESAVVHEYLKKIGCDKGQGYHYSKALPFDELNKWRVHYNRSQIHGVG